MIGDQGAVDTDFTHGLLQKDVFLILLNVSVDGAQCKFEDRYSTV